MRAVARPGTIRRVTTNSGLRIALLIWVVAYLFLACAPILGGHLLIGAIAIAGGIVLFVPWLVGIVILATLIWLTNAPRPPRR